MEFYHKVPVHLQYTLVNYSDFTRKVIYRSKLNQHVVLAKAFPTSKACEKFLVNSTLEFKIELLPELINTLRNAKPGSGVVFYLIGKYENYKKDQIRLVMRDSEWGGFEILQQKKSKALEDEDMEFEEDPQPISTSLPAQDDKWEDMFGVFFIKKNDKIDEIVQVLNDFYVAAGFTSAIKKRKPSKKTPVVGKKPKQSNKEIIIEDECDENENENEEECEINKYAIIELCFFYENSGLSLYECIMLYNDDINNELKDCFKYNFIPLLKNATALYNLQVVLDEMIKKS